MSQVEDTTFDTLDSTMPSSEMTSELSLDSERVEVSSFLIPFRVIFLHALFLVLRIYPYDVMSPVRSS